MNIHINKDEFQFLMASTINNSIFKVGSHLYDLNDENSDTDYLCITYPFHNVVYSPFNSHHQFQYKDIENNIDYNFVDISTFVRNLCSGDSTMNYELLHSPEFKAHGAVNWLCKYTEQFRTYNVIKAYLGFADRDIRHFNRKQGRDKASAMIHIVRGFKFAKDLLNNEFKLDTSILNLLRADDLIVKEFETLLPALKEEIKLFRQNTLNPLFEKKEIPRYLDPEIQYNISNNIANFLISNNKFDLKASLFKKLLSTNENPELKYD